MGRMLTPWCLRLHSAHSGCASPAGGAPRHSRRVLVKGGPSRWLAAQVGAPRLASPYQPARDPHARPPSHTHAQLLCNSRPVVPLPPFLPLPSYMGLTMRSSRCPAVCSLCRHVMCPSCRLTACPSLPLASLCLAGRLHARLPPRPRAASHLCPPLYTRLLAPARPPPSCPSAIALVLTFPPARVPSSGPRHAVFVPGPSA
ncbi:hypothetical protein C8Q72DRAFT_626232 [Fomitopsis betulina]|nr:hypothetical protein C8Q72DRAFT_626232 [Fomitopsis betulina]